MKKITVIFSLACLSLAAPLARAASESEDIFKLPEFVVEAQRVAPAEKAMQKSVDEMRLAARTPVAVEIQLPSLGNKTVVLQTPPARPAPVALVAKV